MPVKICRAEPCRAVPYRVEPSLLPIRIRNYIALTWTGILKSLPSTLPPGRVCVCVRLSGGELAKLVLVLIEFVNNSVMATTFHRSPSQRALATFTEVGRWLHARCQQISSCQPYSYTYIGRKWILIARKLILKWVYTVIYFLTVSRNRKLLEIDLSRSFSHKLSHKTLSKSNI